MTQQTKTPSNVVPVLVAMLVCDVAVAEPTTGKKTLVGIFDRIRAAKFPTQHPMSLYLKLTNAEGYYKTEIKFRQLKTGSVLAGASGELQAIDRLASVDMCIPFPPLLIPESGRYDFQLWANSMFLGSTVLDAELQQ